VEQRLEAAATSPPRVSIADGLGFYGRGEDRAQVFAGICVLL